MSNPWVGGSRLFVRLALCLAFLGPVCRLEAGQDAALATEGGRYRGVESSVVRVFATLRVPDPYKPWSKQAPTEMAGSGVVIKGHRILTCAHVVLYASQVQIQADQSGDKLSGTVESVAPGIDLAVIKLDDESFFDTHPALPFANKLPEIKDAVMAYGFPQGGAEPVDHPGHRFPDRVRVVQLPGGGAADPD